MMAWNKYYIVVTNQTGITPAAVLSKLNLTGYQPAGEATFAQTNKSGDLFIGSYEDKLVIASWELTEEFFGAEHSARRQDFIAAFPDAEIAALAENSTVSYYGYTVICNGEIIRIKSGCDGEVYTDIGALLPEEQAILATPIFEPDELAEMRETMDEEEVQAAIHQEAGWRVPGRLSIRYFGDIIDNLNDSAMILTRYRKA